MCVPAIRAEIGDIDTQGFVGLSLSHIVAIVDRSRETGANLVRSCRILRWFSRLFSTKKSEASKGVA